MAAAGFAIDWKLRDRCRKGVWSPIRKAPDPVIVRYLRLRERSVPATPAITSASVAGSGVTSIAPVV